MAIAPGLTGEGLVLAELLAAEGRRVPPFELLGLTGLAFRAVLWSPRDNATDDEGTPTGAGGPWPAASTVFPEGDVAAALAAATGVALEREGAAAATSRGGAVVVAATPARAAALAVVAEGEVYADGAPLALVEGDVLRVARLEPPQAWRERAHGARLSAARAALAQGTGGVTGVDGVRYTFGPPALELAATLAADPAGEGDAEAFDWAAAWTALRNVALELRVARAAAAAFLEAWALDVEEHDLGDVDPAALRASGRAYRAVVRAAGDFLAAWPDTPELLAADPKQRMVASDALRGAAGGERTALASLRAALAEEA